MSQLSASTLSASASEFVPSFLSVPNKDIVTNSGIDLPSLFTALQDPPSIADTIALFTLDTAQSQFFVLFATDMLEYQYPLLHDGALMPGERYFDDGRLRLLCLGPPGCGKTQAGIASQWFMFQHKLIECLLLTAYPHKAAALMNTPCCKARTVCKLFAINPHDRHSGRACLFPDLSDKTAESLGYLGDARWIIMDEISFIALHTLELCSASLNRQFVMKYHHDNPREFFGDIGLILTGDYQQHRPPCGKPPFYKADLEDSVEPAFLSRDARPPLRPEEQTGRNAIKSVIYTILLTCQHRMRNDPEFFRLATIFNSEKDITDEDIDAFCALVNRSVVNSMDLMNEDIDKSPRVVVTRNALKHILAHLMDIAQARTYFQAYDLMIYPCISMITAVHDSYTYLSYICCLTIVSMNMAANVPLINLCMPFCM